MRYHNTRWLVVAALAVAGLSPPAGARLAAVDAKGRPLPRVAKSRPSLPWHLDRIDQPDLGSFLEVKSRTWSLRDAEHKALLIADLLEVLGVSGEKRVTQDYLEMVLATQDHVRDYKPST